MSLRDRIVKKINQKYPILCTSAKEIQDQLGVDYYSKSGLQGF